MAKIFVTGGSGHLGRMLVDYLKREHEVYAPRRSECDILDRHEIWLAFETFKPDIVIHLAAFVDTFGCEDDLELALAVNVRGTLNIVQACINLECKFVYVSSEYVFSGNKGNYTIDDKLDPINVYGKTKAAAEYIVSILPNHQIIRAPFIKEVYPKVFTDQYCSRHFLDDVVSKVAKNILLNDDKIVHIATERASLYELYQKKGINAEPINMDVKYLGIIPKDTSLK